MNKETANETRRVLKLVAKANGKTEWSVENTIYLTGEWLINQNHMHV